MQNSEKQIRIIFFADTHLGFDYPLRPKIDRRRRGPDFFQNFERVLEYAAREKADLVIHGGDLFFRSRVPVAIVDRVYQRLFEFADEIPLLLVPGNHERSKLPESLFLEHPGLLVLDQPKTLSIKLNHAVVAISGFPCVRKNVRDYFKSYLAQTQWTKIQADFRLLCLHQAIEGAQVGPVNFTFRHGSDVVQMHDLPAEFLAVLSGHIHRQQVLWKNKKIPVIFPGSVERTSFAEKDEPKGFYELRIGKNQSSGWAIEHLDFIELPSRPMVDLWLEDGLDSTNIKKFFTTKIEKIPEDAIVRLKFRGEVPLPIRLLLTQRMLREVFPDTMNVELGSDFYLPDRK